LVNGLKGRLVEIVEANRSANGVMFGNGEKGSQNKKIINDEEKSSNTYEEV
jgi:hypothetical protein